MTDRPTRILYCHCAYAKVVPAEVKAAVLRGLSEADVEFDAVPDLCEMAAHGDGRLREIASQQPLRIAACYPRAVRWLLASSGAQVPENGVRVWNMRTEPADAVLAGLLSDANDGAASSNDGAASSNVGADFRRPETDDASPVEPMR